MKGPKTPAQIASLLKRSLKHGGIQAGQRLKPARELAEMLDVSHATVNRAMELLAGQGILAKRHGSGTFLRKLPTDLPSAPPRKSQDTLPPHLLFADPPELQRLQAPPTQQALNIGLWTDVFWSSATHDLIVAGIQQRARELGHHVELHSLVAKANVPHSLEELSRILAQSRLDGHIVYGPHASLFAATGQRSPVVYYGGQPPPEFAPSIQTDVDTTPRRAVEILAAQGYRRIAMAIDPTLRTLHFDSFKLHEFSYTATVQYLGLHYRKIIDVNPGGVTELASQFSATANPAAPDAIFVADDHLSDIVAAAIRKVGLQPGRNFGLVSISHRGGHPLPRGIQWSTLEFDTDQYGQILVGRVVAMIQTAGTRPINLLIQPLWKPGDSHRRTPIT